MYRIDAQVTRLARIRRPSPPARSPSWGRAAQVPVDVIGAGHNRDVRLAVAPWKARLGATSTLTRAPCALNVLLFMIVFILQSGTVAASSSDSPCVRNASTIGTGCRFTSIPSTGMLELDEVGISMDGRGSVFENIFVERLWRTVEYEEIPLRDHHRTAGLHAGLSRNFRYYKEDRPCPALQFHTPTACAAGVHNIDYIPMDQRNGDFLRDFGRSPP